MTAEECEVNRDGKWVMVKPTELTTDELCDILSDVQIDSDELIGDREVSMWYAAIREAIERLEKYDEQEKMK